MVVWRLLDGEWWQRETPFYLEKLARQIREGELDATHVSAVTTLRNIADEIEYHYDSA